MITFHPPETNFNIGDYHQNTIKYYKQRFGAQHIGWLEHDDERGNYYTLDNLDKVDYDLEIWSNVTPLLFIRRNSEQINPFHFEGELNFKIVHFINGLGHPQFKNVKLEEGEWKEIIDRFPFCIYTLGRDDGNIGWYFSNLDEVEQFLKELKELVFDISYWDFKDLYSKNEGWIN